MGKVPETKMSFSVLSTTVMMFFLCLQTVELTDVCPSFCRCVLLDNITSHVTCSNQSLSSVPNIVSNGVTFLDLSSNSIESLEDSSFDNLHNVTKLILDNNRISAIKPKVFASVPKLTELDVSNNDILSLDTMTFFGLLQLKVLHLRRNKISNVSVDTFFHTTSLERLDLSFNNIQYLPDSVFEGLFSLTYLELQGNTLLSFPPVQFSLTFQPIYINLSMNQLTDLNNVPLNRLEYLSISWNNISKLTTQTFQNASNLKTLNLDGNPLSEIWGRLFPDGHGLRDLSLAKMPNLHYLSPTTFEGLTNVTQLNISYNYQLSFIPMDLFIPVHALEELDMRSSNVSVIFNETFRGNTMLEKLYLAGNPLTCDCGLQWVINSIQSNESIITDVEYLKCNMPDSNSEILLHDLQDDELHCAEVKIVNFTAKAHYKIGSTAILSCHAISQPAPVITWITPRNKHFVYHNFHEYAIQGHLPRENTSVESQYHADHSWHSSDSYYSESDERTDRIVVLQDGSLYIDYVMRSDAGPYTCIASNPQNETKIVIKFTLDYQVISFVKIWSFIVGFACAGSFFLLNLIYSLTLAAVRRCISKRRRERIGILVENLDNYKTAQIARIKENYNTQVGRIRDQYHYQLGRLREHNVQKMGRIKEGCSNKMERIRDNYNGQLARLKDYSSSQLEQIRERYNNQILKIKDYGSSQFGRIHEKYKLQQQHVIKLLEVMNLDNCRSTFESDCVRTESIILHSDLFPDDVPISPLDSASISDSEYLTAASSDSDIHISRDDLVSLDGDDLYHEVIGVEGDEMIPWESDPTGHPYVTNTSGMLNLQVSDLCVAGGSMSESMPCLQHHKVMNGGAAAGGGENSASEVNIVSAGHKRHSKRKRSKKNISETRLSHSSLHRQLSQLSQCEINMEDRGQMDREDEGHECSGGHSDYGSRPEKCRYLDLPEMEITDELEIRESIV